MGCGEVAVYDVETKYSHPVMVPPVSKYERSVFIRVKDASGYASEISSSVERTLEKAGYKVELDPSKARFKLLVNVIKFGSGSDEDYLTYLQAIDPKQAANLLIEKNKVRRVQDKTNVYTNDNRRSNWPFAQPKKTDVHIDNVRQEDVVFSRYADRVALLDVEIIGTHGENLYTRVMVGINLRGGLFVSPTAQVIEQGWTRLIQRIALAIGGMF